MVARWAIFSDEQRRLGNTPRGLSGPVAASGFRSCRPSEEGEIDTAADIKASDRVSNPNVVGVQTVQEEQRAILLVGSCSWHPAMSPGLHDAACKKIMSYIGFVGRRHCEALNNSVHQDIELSGVVSEPVRFPGLQQRRPCNLMVGGAIYQSIDFWRLKIQAGEQVRLSRRSLFHRLWHALA
ncbi:hypothetical protein AnigIFM63604_003312 [Aspergillus niger]|uniref:Uncharacterized protein n=1 Tax=Aspergillus niger TaxID=5061 RepID=A0A9W6ACU8_ASPNG|nr:hypothetical protein AnigIFM63604_003312 [Aspergillus niger]